MLLYCSKLVLNFIVSKNLFYPVQNCLRMYYDLLLKFEIRKLQRSDWDNNIKVHKSRSISL